MKIREYLKDNILPLDGAMGTYFSTVYEDPLYKCEWANITSPNTVKEIHKRYLNAGAKAIKTNTFSAYDVGNSDVLFQEIIRKGYQIAEQIAKEYDAYILCDIGPIQAVNSMDLFEIYKQIVDEFIKVGGENFLFETFTDGAFLNDIACYIKEKLPDAYIITSFAVNPDGYSKTGESGSQLLLNTCEKIDSIGFNCVCGPHHMNRHVNDNKIIGKPMIIMPNAGYPTVLGNRVIYENNPQYFAKQMMKNVKDGAGIIGGCCGTTPSFIRAMSMELVKLQATDFNAKHSVTISKLKEEQEGIIVANEFYEKLKTNQMPIAVELDSPVNTQISDFLQGAKTLKDHGVDMITIADCPIARARMDSSLLACKLKRELQVDVMPHMTCRDRNINASKALLLGLNIEEINNVLIVTGDPIPSEQRGEVKSVYEFNSRMLIKHISNLNQTLFESPFYLYAALNINARNFEVQLRLAKQKVEHGAMAFFTQPVLSEEALENLKLAKKELTVPIVGGILPIVSERNAKFINSEIPGIKVSEKIVSLYEGKSREEGTDLAIKISSEIAKKIRPYSDGYYIITPFKRVDIVTEIIKNIQDTSFTID